VTRFILADSHLDADRLVAYSAKKHGVQTQYLPHGLSYEEYSGMHDSSFFSADQALAWNEDSRIAFQRLNSDSHTVRHPVNQRKIIPLQKLSKNCRAWRVLVLLPEWPGIISQAGREDCAIVDLIESYHGLTAMGVRGSRIHVKYHGVSGIQEVRAAKEIHLKRLQRSLGMQFLVLDSSLHASDVMTQYDLMITNPTTAILEAVLRGIPVVLFGDGFNRIGALSRYSLPQARKAEDMKTAVDLFFSDGMGDVYARLAQSLQSGNSLSEFFL
jgi:hypothetical protein